MKFDLLCPLAFSGRTTSSTSCALSSTHSCRDNAGSLAWSTTTTALPLSSSTPQGSSNPTLCGYGASSLWVYNANHFLMSGPPCLINPVTGRAVKRGSLMYRHLTRTGVTHTAGECHIDPVSGRARIGPGATARRGRAALPLPTGRIVQPPTTLLRDLSLRPATSAPIPINVATDRRRIAQALAENEANSIRNATEILRNPVFSTDERERLINAIVVANRREVDRFLKALGGQGPGAAGRGRGAPVA